MTDTLTNAEHGDATIARDGEILRTEVGSGLHGIAIAGTDDHDEMGVFIEPPECAIGLAGPMDHYVWRTQPEGHRSGPGDTDLVMYSLRKFLKLAIAGNPTILLPLFAPDESVYNVTDLGAELRELLPRCCRGVPSSVSSATSTGRSTACSAVVGKARSRPDLSSSNDTATTSNTRHMRSGSGFRVWRSPSTPG